MLFRSYKRRKRILQVILLYAIGSLNCNKNNMARVLVLGGNGFIGRNLVEELWRRGHDVYSFDLNSPDYKMENVHYLEGDFFDDFVLEQTLNDMDIIYHAICTMNPGNSNSKYIVGYERDLIQSIKLCDMMKDKNKKIIFLSSGGTVYGKQEIFPVLEESIPVPINHYGNLKLCIENAMRVFKYQNKMNIVIARIANPYGPGQDYKKGVGFIDAAMKRALNDEVIEIWGNGEVVRDYIFISDVCEALAILAERDIEYDIINISSGRGMSQNEVISIIQKFFPSIKVSYKQARTVDTDIIYLSNDRLRKIWKKPMITLENGIEYYYHYLTSSNQTKEG